MPATEGVITASRLNVRPEPSTGRPPIASLPRGARIDIVESHGAWYRIRAGDLEGFVHGDYVRLREAEPAAGFLRERPEFHSAPLEAPEGSRLAVRPEASAREKTVARTWNQTGGLLGRLAEAVAVDEGAALAVVCVESAGRGFTAGRLTIRFEVHIFWREWGRAHPAVFGRHFRFDAARPWTGHAFRSRSNAAWKSFHGDQGGEWEAFEFARKLDEDAALRSASMGAPQIMGFNFARIGYGSVRAMFEAFRSGLRAQILGLFDFIKGPGSSSELLEALRRGRFADFAARYNGPAQAARYAARLERDLEIYRKLKAG